MIKRKALASILTTLVITLVFSGCTSSSTTEVPENKEPVEKTEQKEKASKTAKYKIEFIAEWSSSTHPNHYPSGAHFSPFIAYSHDNSKGAKIFSLGETPTPGVEEMSETGATDILIREIGDLIDSGFVYKQTKGSVFDSPGINSSELEISKDYSYVTFVSMLAPSPDWFVYGSTKLFKNNKWVEKVEIKLTTYDSGGDSGQELTSEDQDSNPKEPVTIFDDTLQNLGKLILTRIDSR
jgi:hypothetical protein